MGLKGKINFSLDKEEDEGDEKKNPNFLEEE
jgi:hypothetical protein